MEEEKDITIESDENLDDSVIAEESAKDTITNLKEKLKKAVEEKQQHLTELQRAKADFVNMRKRDEELRIDTFKFANENLIIEIIPVLDSFEIAMANKEMWEKVDKNWRIGVEHIYSQLKTILVNNNLLEINPLGEKFNPMRDEAIEFEIVDDESKNDIITKVIQKGYSLNGKIIKSPKVKIGQFKK
ncbi:MAG: nucleotide exchange factor GrpE [Patescibacteria group bacterium]|nr:nucleotide exchange factor GrpE [Patescibacteria group bacterium]